MIVEFLDEASDEAMQAYQYYEDRQSGLGTAFRTALEAALLRVEARPMSCPAIDADTRKCRLQRFPYNLLFRLLDERVLIIAVAHDRRKPGYWHKRTEG